MKRNFLCSSYVPVEPQFGFFSLFVRIDKFISCVISMPSNFPIPASYAFPGAMPMTDIMRPAADPSARWEKNSPVLQQVQAFKS